MSGVAQCLQSGAASRAEALDAGVPLPFCCWSCAVFTPNQATLHPPPPSRQEPLPAWRAPLFFRPRRCPHPTSARLPLLPPPLPSPARGSLHNKILCQSNSALGTCRRRTAHAVAQPCALPSPKPHPPKKHHRSPMPTATATAAPPGLQPRVSHNPLPSLPTRFLSHHPPHAARESGPPPRPCPKAHRQHPAMPQAPACTAMPYLN